MCPGLLYSLVSDTFRLICSSSLHVQFRSNEMGIKIRFGTTNASSRDRAMLLTCSYCVFVVLITGIELFLQECNQSSLRLQTANSTLSRANELVCSPIFAKCVSPIVLTRTESSKNCKVDIEFACNRIFILVSLTLQILLIHELFTVNGDSSRKFVHIMWLVSFLTFVGVMIGTYWNDYSHRYITFTLHIICGIMNSISMFDWVGATIPEPNIANAMIDIRMDHTDQNETRAKSWQEILWFLTYYAIVLYTYQLCFLICCVEIIHPSCVSHIFSWLFDSCDTEAFFHCTNYKKNI